MFKSAMQDDTYSVDFCTLGMFIIDEIHFLPPKPPVYNILGGAGTYAALGARIFAPSSLSKSVGWIVDAGSDFPPKLRDLIGSWRTSCLIRETPERLTTRGWNGYGAADVRAFKYTTPKLRLDHSSLDERLSMSKSFHFICSPSRCIDLVENILKRRNGMTRPLFIWEPVPDLCIPNELAACCRALKVVDIVSPNHAELCGFFGEEPQQQDGRTAFKTVERCSDLFLQSGIGISEGKGAVVIRAGKDGCYIATTGSKKWIPAFHQNADKVLDPTGGGNAFLGGLSIGLARGTAATYLENLQKAAIRGSVSASFAIEQVGMPKLMFDGDQETWNGDEAESRVEELAARLEAFAQCT